MKKLLYISFFAISTLLITACRAYSFTGATTNADLRLEGEITGYRINPMSATAQQTAAQNRLTVTINVRFYNALDEEKDFEKSFSFYSDFNSNEQLVGGVLEGALDEILERIHQDIFNAALGDW